MKILYVTRDARLSKPQKTLRAELQQRLKAVGLNIKRHFFFSPIDGYFEASLCHAGNVTRVSNSKFSKQSLIGQDALVVNFRCVGGKLIGDQSRLIEITQGFSGVKALFIDADKASMMLDDTVLDNYDIVFKREPFLDLDRYPLSSANKKKVRPTMLSCPYFKYSPYGFLNSQKHQSLLNEQTSEKVSDVFFIGKASAERIEAWAQLREKPDLTISGGLLPRKGIPLDPSLTTAPISEEAFISNLKKTRINLAIDGHGEFTFRHLEVWCAGGFLLAHANLRDIWLPMSVQEHEHYECYSDTDDLMEKIEYFRQHPKDAARIAENGRKIFQSEYSIEYHGNDIRRHLAGSA